MKLTWAELKRAITGPGLFYAPSYLFVLPVFWLTSLLSTAHLGDWKSLVLWSIANFLAMGVCWGLIVFADRFVFAKRKESWIIGVLFFSAVIGSVKGGSTTLFGAFFGVENHFAELISGRMIQTALLGLITLPALAILANTRSRFQNERDALVAERVRVAATEAQVDSATNNEYLLLAEEIGKLRDGIQASSNLEVSTLIRDIVQNGLRPITHRLWAREDQKQTNFTLRDLSRVAIVSHPYVYWPVALILFLGTLGPYVAASGWPQGLARSILTSGLIVVTYLLARLVKTQNVIAAWSYYIFVHIVLSLAIVATSKLLFGELSGFTLISAFFVLFIWILQTGYMTSFVVGAVATHNEMRTQLQLFSDKLGLDRAVIQARAQVVKREVANFLHSELQNKLLALALRVETGETKLPSATLELRAIQELLQAGAVADSKDKRSLPLQLRDLAERWAGFVEIHFDLGSFQPDQNTVRQVVLVVNEGLSNAVRHGLATEVQVKVTSKNGRAQIEILDDGIGPRSGVPGLGSMFFESTSGSQWSLTQRKNGGSRLLVSV